jgi:hypothetical protein
MTIRSEPEGAPMAGSRPSLLRAGLGSPTLQNRCQVRGASSKRRCITADRGDYLATAWWLATFPGVAITLLGLGLLFLGDWLRDVLDPRLRGR